MWRSIVIAVSLGLLLPHHSVAKDQKQHYRFVVSWSDWDGEDFDARDKLDISLNGKSIGSTAVAFKVLEDIPVEKGEHVKLQLPRMPQGRPVSRPPYCLSRFIHRWMERGAQTDIFENGVRLNAHTVTFSDFVVNGGYVKNELDITWIVDGKPVGKGKQFLTILEKWAKQGDVLLQWVDPVEWNPPDLIFMEVYGRVLDLVGEKKLRLFRIRPFPDENAPADK